MSILFVGTERLSFFCLAYGVLSFFRESGWKLWASPGARSRISSVETATVIILEVSYNTTENTQIQSNCANTPSLAGLPLSVLHMFLTCHMIECKNSLDIAVPWSLYPSAKLRDRKSFFRLIKILLFFRQHRRNAKKQSISRATRHFTSNAK